VPTRYVLEQSIKWQFLISEIFWQRTADLMSAFFIILEYKQKAGESFVGQFAIDQAIKDQYGIFARTRQSLPSWAPGSQIVQRIPLEKLVINY
jgi:hypothetical protein